MDAHVGPYSACDQRGRPVPADYLMEHGYVQEIEPTVAAEFAAAFDGMVSPDEIIDYDTANLQFRPLIQRPLRGEDIRPGVYHSFAGSDPHAQDRVHGVHVIGGSHDDGDCTGAAAATD